MLSDVLHRPLANPAIFKLSSLPKHEDILISPSCDNIVTGFSLKLRITDQVRPHRAWRVEGLQPESLYWYQLFRDYLQTLGPSMIHSYFVKIWKRVLNDGSFSELLSLLRRRFHTYMLEYFRLNVFANQWHLKKFFVLSWPLKPRQYLLHYTADHVWPLLGKLHTTVTISCYYHCHRNIVLVHKFSARTMRTWLSWLICKLNSLT